MPSWPPPGAPPSPRLDQAARNAAAVAASAGKNDSMASSATVMSTAVPNVASVLKNAGSAPRRCAARAERTASTRRRHRRRGSRPRRGTRAARRRGRRGRRRRGDVLAVERVRRWALHSGRFPIRGARPSGCRLTRRALAGGASRLGIDAARQERQRRPVRRHEVPPSVDDERRERLVAREDLVEGVAHRCHLAGLDGGLAKHRARSPAARRSVLRSRSGTSRCSARWSRSSRLGRDRPVSTKLRCRGDTSASTARSSWLRRRRWRQSFSSPPTPRFGVHDAHDVDANGVRSRRRLPVR